MNHHSILHGVGRLTFALMILMAIDIIVPGTCLAKQEINYRLKWLFNVNVIGDIVADQQGLFNQEGLSVTVKEGGPERDAIRELELGHAQFGVASSDQVIRALSKKSPVVVIAQLFQVNPLHWIYRAGSLNLTKPADLKGLRIGVTFGGNDETIMRTLLAKAELDEGDISLYSARYDFTPFYTCKVDLWPCYINSQGPILSQKLADAGETVAFFNPDAFGVRFVANSVVTSKKMLMGQPDTVSKFTRALLKAWKQALDPQAEKQVLAILVRFDRDTPEDLLARQLNLSRKLIQPEANIPIGTINVDAWKQTEEIMLAQKVIPEPVHVVEHLMPQQ